LENFLEGALNQGLKLDYIKPTMIIDELEDLVLATLWEVLKVNLNKVSFQNSSLTFKNRKKPMKKSTSTKTRTSSV